MFLKTIQLQNFRSYEKADFKFNERTTFIIGPNTSGKTNIIEAIYFLTSGKSFRTEKDLQTITFEADLARVKGIILPDGHQLELEVVLTNGEIGGKKIPLKKFLVNGVSRRRVDFMGNLFAVIFSPVDLEIIVDSPSLRRRFLDEVLEQVDKDYRLASTLYEKALRQRNALLTKAKEEGVRAEKEFEYWDNILIKNGEMITQKREELFEFLNSFQKDIFDFATFYDKSVISEARLEQYKDVEIGVGATLVGPHRDDFSVHMYNNSRQTTHDVKFFGSRGQQRLVILQLKFLQLDFIQEKIGERPIFLLDDIFSELDEDHITLIMEMVGKQQTIITTTHKEFINKKLLKDSTVIELELDNGRI